MYFYMIADRPVAVATALLAVLLVWARFDEFAVGSMADDAVYAELARSIAEGRGPVLHLHLDEQAIAPTTQPSGYPLLISPVAWLFPDSLTALKLCSAAFYIAYLAVFNALLTPCVERRTRLAVIALIALNPWTIAYANRVFSESAYMLVSLGGAWFYDRWLRGRILSADLAGLVLCLAFGAAIRSIGFALVLAVGLHLAYRRLWRHLGWWIPCQAALLGLLMAFSRPSGGSLVPGSYLDQLVGADAALFDRLSFIAWTLFYYLVEFAALALPVFGQAPAALATQQGLGGLYAVVAWSIGALVLLGALLGILRWRAAAALQLLWLYQLIFLAVLCNWTFIPLDRPGGWTELRLLIPLLPLVYLFATGGLQQLATRLPRLTSALPLVLAATLAMSAAHNAYRIKVPFREARQAAGRGFIDYSTGAAWIRANTDRDAVVMTSSPLERHIHHNRPSIGYTTEWTRAQYLFIGPADPNTPDALTPDDARLLEQVQSQPNRFRPTVSGANWHIFRVLR